MARPLAKPIPLILGPEPDPDALPQKITTLQGVTIGSHYFGPLSAQAIRKWPLRWHVFNGRQVTDTRAFLAEAQRRFA
jgi:hypothetical protein